VGQDSGPGGLGLYQCCAAASRFVSVTAHDHAHNSSRPTRNATLSRIQTTLAKSRAVASLRAVAAAAHSRMQRRSRRRAPERRDRSARSHESAAARRHASRAALTSVAARCVSAVRWWTHR
jgi:hypothetical protein